MKLSELIHSYTTLQQIYWKLIGILGFWKLRMSSKVWDSILYIMDIYIYIYI